MTKAIIVPVFGIILLLIDLYVFQAIRVIAQDMAPFWRRLLYGGYWGVTGLVMLGYFSYHFLIPDMFPRAFRTFLMVGVFIHYFAKSFAMVFLVIDDVIRAGKWVISLFSTDQPSVTGEEANKISRSEFLAWAAVAAGTIPVVSMTFGIISGAHDYRIRRKKIALKNLPDAFNGIRIGQISDIHSGSFFNRTAVRGGVDMLLKEKPDMIFFTGDLVNNQTSEVKDYIGIFDKVQAPLGVYSTTGNHDYGDYRSWSTPDAKRKNFQDLIDAHRELGWDILMNKNRMIRVDGEEIAVLGIENWGTGRFPKYGKLDQAYKGTEDKPVKLLLSHDPSHWDAQIREEYPDIDITFAGHTHGFQFGVEAGNFKWSPSQYVYKQWAGLYSKDDQHLYVNRGYGYLGYPGRIGIPPEITIIELVKA